MMKGSRNIVRLNPANTPAPVGRYSHVTIVPRNSELYTFSGQVGVDGNGHFTKDLNSQVDQTFKNIAEILDSQNLTSENVVKVNIWATEEIDWEFFNATWEALFGAVYPSMTVGYVKALGLPDIKIEVEIWAAKP